MILLHTQSPPESSLKFTSLLLSHIAAFTQGAQTVWCAAPYTLLYCTLMQSQNDVPAKCCPASRSQEGRSPSTALWWYVSSQQGSPAHQELLLSKPVCRTERTGMDLLLHSSPKTSADPSPFPPHSPPILSQSEISKRQLSCYPSSRHSTFLNPNPDKGPGTGLSVAR